MTLFFAALLIILNLHLTEATRMAALLHLSQPSLKLDKRTYPYIPCPLHPYPHKIKQLLLQHQIHYYKGPKNTATLVS